MAELSKRDRELLRQMSLEDPAVLEQIRSTPNVPTERVPDQEGLMAFLDGLIAGDFSDNSTWSAAAGQTIGGFIPGVGQVADVRDLSAAISNEDALGVGIGAAAFIPGMDWLKSLRKARQMRKYEKAVKKGRRGPGEVRNPQADMDLADERRRQWAREQPLPDARLDETVSMSPNQLNKMRSIEAGNYRTFDIAKEDELDALIEEVNTQIRKAQGDKYPEWLK